MANPAAIASLPTWLAFVVVVLGFAAAVAVYFLPFIIGEIRRVPHVGSIFSINLFLGWSLIGWVVALAMAMRTKAPPVTPVLSNHPVPGWYPDPTTGDTRWWDGNRWGPAKVSDPSARLSAHVPGVLPGDHVE